jgi:hypothetical protein
MEKCVEDPSSVDLSIHTSCGIKTEVGGNSNTADVGGHELHCIKTI